MDFNNKIVKLKKNEDKRIRFGHQWIFNNEILSIDNKIENGDIVLVNDFYDKKIGYGFFNKNSLISVRLLSENLINNLYELFRERIITAYQTRKYFYPAHNSFRLLFSESDFIPGLIIDKYNDTYVLQIYSIGIEKNINLIIDILKKEFNAKNIFTTNDFYFRKLEGLPETNTIYFGNKEDEIIEIYSIKYKIDFEKSQKTGFYFDQSDNRLFIEKFCKDKNVLDAFCYNGGFGLHAAKSCANEITFLDLSSTAIENAKENFKINNFNSKFEFINADVFDTLNKFIQDKKRFDVVMIDPPSFAKQKKNIPAAKKGYEKLNRLAISCVNKNGILVTSSCSHHLIKENFIEIINKAAIKENRKLQQLYFNEASLDHPKIPSMQETSYLKFAVFKLLD